MVSHSTVQVSISNRMDVRQSKVQTTSLSMPHARYITFIAAFACCTLLCVPHSQASFTDESCAQINATAVVTCLENEGNRQITFFNETRIKLFISSADEQQYTYTISCQARAEEMHEIVENLPAIAAVGAQRDVIIDGCLPFEDLLERLNIPSSAVAKIQGGVAVTTLARGDLQTLQHNTLLAVSAFAELAADAFADLHSLTSLELTRITCALPAQLLQPLQNLTHLWLREFKMEQPPAGLFDGLSSLESIDLSYNELSAIGADTFATQQQLLSLDLSNNRLTYLPRDAFQSLQQLTQLRIFNNRLQSLPLGLFAPLSSLRYLELDNNEIDIPAQEACSLFDGLAALEYLELSNNSLSNFCFNLNLTFVSIKVAHNKIANLRLQAGVMLQKLLHLNVRHNRLQRLHADVLQYLHDTGAELSLAHNSWQCDRRADQWLVFVQLQRRKVRDIAEVRCAGDANTKITELAVCDICQVAALPLLQVVPLAAVSALTVLLLVTTLLYRRKAQRALQNSTDGFEDVKLMESKG